jgi:signal transduction histidine kinase/ActR/RegA family two-component response regulator
MPLMTYCCNALLFSSAAMSLKNRIYLIFSVSGLFLVLMAWSSHNYIIQLEKAFASFTDKSIPVFRDIQDLRLSSLQLLANSQRLLENESSLTSQLLQSSERQKEKLAATNAHYIKAVELNFLDEKHYSDEIEKNLNIFLQTVSTTEQSIKRARTTAETQALSTSLNLAHDQLSVVLDQAYLHEDQEFDEEKNSSTLALVEMNRFNLLRIVLGLIMLAVLAYLSQRLLKGAILRMTNSANLLVSGQIPVASPGKLNDEVSVFEKHFYDIAKQLRNFNHEQERLHTELKNQIVEKEQALLAVREHEQLLSKQVAERTKELEAAKIRAEQASAAKTTFLANMSHEIRTPLNAVIGLARVLEQQAISLPVGEHFRSHLERIRQGGEVLLATVNTILDITKIEAGKMPIFEEEFALEDTLLGLCSIFETQAQQKDVSFQRNLDPSLLMMVRTDRSKLIQVVNNLLSNAIKFTPAGGAVTLQASRKNSLLTLRVIDNGVGIPAGRLNAIFDSFEQADDSITRKHGGSGLGLTIAKRLIDFMHGQISVTSNVGQGSEFTVRLPMEFISPAQQLPLENQDASQEIVWGNIHILVVEDNEVNQAVIDAILRSFGVNVTLASNGLQAIDMLKTKKPDLILMDLHMPNMSGIDTTRLILSEPKTKHIPIIALSADALVDQQSNAIAAGMVDYLIKPVDLSKLRYTLRKHLLMQKALLNT